MNTEKPITDLPKDQFVALTNRHAAAQFEYNTRIQARHTVMNLYLASATLLVAQVYSKGGFSGNTSPDNDMAIACAFAIPFASLICALLMKMHDDMMGQLHNFMMTCELYGVGAALPGYHVMEPWSSALLKTRKTQNLVMIVVFLSLSGAASYAIFRLAGAGWSAVGGIISCSAAWIEFTSFKNRQKAAKRARKLLGIKEHEPIEWPVQQTGHRFD